MSTGQVILLVIILTVLAALVAVGIVTLARTAGERRTLLRGRRLAEMEALRVSTEQQAAFDRAGAALVRVEGVMHTMAIDRVNVAAVALEGFADALEAHRAQAGLRPADPRIPAHGEHLRRG